MIRLQAVDNRIGIFGNTFPIKDILKALPGRKWHDEEKFWSFPLSASSFRLLLTLLPEAVVDDSLSNMNHKVAHLDEAYKSKRATNLTYPLWAKTEPWTHQRQAFWFSYYRLMAQGGAQLALDMGCGKSKVAIDLMNAFKCRRVLIICPTSVMDVWPEQFEVHSCWPWHVHVGDRKYSVTRRSMEAMEWFDDEHEARVAIVVNHEAVWRKPFGEWALNQNWDMVLVDEIHRAKTPGGKFSRWLARVPSTVVKAYRLGLTGTPLPHSLLDEYAQARFLDPTVFGTNYQVFKSKYAVTGGYGNYQILGFKNTEDFNEKFHELAIQVKAADTLDLPDSIHVNRYTELDHDEQLAYDAMKEETIAQVKDGTITAANALVKLLRLAQIVQGTVTNDMGTPTVIGSSKMTLLADVLEDLNEPVVVFCRFKCDLKNIAGICAGLNRYHYQLSGEKNELHLWKEDCEAGLNPVIAVQIQAGGVGISMVQARYCIYMSKDFNLGSYEQSLARVHRPGQHENVTYIHLITKGTIDETINRALAKRKNAVEAILAELGGEDETV